MADDESRVYLPGLLRDNLGLAELDALQAFDHGLVKIDGKPYHGDSSVPRNEVAGKRIEVKLSPRTFSMVIPEEE
jgi:hypothetical protein